MGGLFSLDSPFSLPCVKMERTPNEKLCSKNDKHCIPNDKLYRKNIFNHRENISIELQTLLPTIGKSKLEEIPSQESMGTDEGEICDVTYDTVQAILPVLVLGYIEGRRGPSNKKNKKSKKSKENKEGGEGKIGERIFRGTAHTFENLLCHEDVDAYRHELQNIGSIFKPKCWDKVYSRLKYAKIDPKEMENKLLYFGDIMLFLFLAYKMKNFCNLTLSCALFEEFSGSVGFFDIHFPRIDNGYTFNGTHDDPKKEKIIYYLDKMFGADINSDKRIELWNEALDRYVVFTINEVVCREENQLRRSFSEGEWAKNGWADELMSCPPVQGWLGEYCSHGNEIVDDSLYQMLKINSYFESEEGKKSFSKLQRIYYNRESKQIKKLRGNGPYTVEAVRLAKIRIKRPMIRIRKSILRKNITNNVMRVKIRTCRYAAIIRRPTIRTEKSMLRKNITNNVKRDKIRTCRYAAIIRRPTIRTEKSILRKNITNSVKRDRIFTCRYVIKPVARWFHRQKKFAHWKSKILRHPEFIKFWSTTARPQEIEALKKAAKRQKNVYGETSTQEGSTPA